MLPFLCDVAGNGGEDWDNLNVLSPNGSISGTRSFLLSGRGPAKEKISGSISGLWIVAIGYLPSIRTLGEKPYDTSTHRNDALKLGRCLLVFKFFNYSDIKLVIVPTEKSN